jgi:predicted house-cleaning noncanonical NTP pyrophosphatase (MazG superfamily)
MTEGKLVRDLIPNIIRETGREAASWKYPSEE